MNSTFAPATLATGNKIASAAVVVVPAVVFALIEAGLAPAANVPVARSKFAVVLNPL
ncbi:hypothetical protein D3C72_1636560 [compost metagenome]